MDKKKLSKAGEYAIEILIAVVGVVWAKYTADKDFDERYEKKRQEERENEQKLLECNEKC